MIKQLVSDGPSTPLSSAGAATVTAARSIGCKLTDYALFVIGALCCICDRITCFRPVLYSSLGGSGDDEDDDDDKEFKCV